MTECLILCRSLTTAQRFNRHLEQCGFFPRIVRTPNDLSNNGCGYAVSVPENLAGLCVSCLKNKGFSPGKVFLVGEVTYREWLP